MFRTEVCDGLGGLAHQARRPANKSTAIYNEYCLISSHQFVDQEPKLVGKFPTNDVVVRLVVLRFWFSSRPPQGFRCLYENRDWLARRARVP